MEVSSTVKRYALTCQAPTTTSANICPPLKIESTLTNLADNMERRTPPHVISPHSLHPIQLITKTNQLDVTAPISIQSWERYIFAIYTTMHSPKHSWHWLDIHISWNVLGLPALHGGAWSHRTDEVLDIYRKASRKGDKRCSKEA